jgi:paired amphipathic helix protein Sin3a
MRTNTASTPTTQVTATHPFTKSNFLFFSPPFSLESFPSIPSERIRPQYGNARKLLMKVRKDFDENPQRYALFVEVLQSLKTGKLSREEASNRISDLFKFNRDLCGEILSYFPPASASTLNATPTSNKEPDSRNSKRFRLETSTSDLSANPQKESTANFFRRFRRKLNDESLFRMVLKAFHLYGCHVLRLHELGSLLRDNLRHRPHLYQRLKRQFGFRDPDDIDIEASDVTRSSLGPSYRILASNESRPKCSGRTAIGDEVLNDVLVSSPTGSEDSGFKLTRKNAYEEELFRCEDQRCELDLAIELNDSAIRALESIHTRLRAAGPSNTKLIIADNEISILHIRAIEKIYADKAAEIIENLYLNPLLVIPLLLRRLKQKGNEWLQCRQEFLDGWRELYSKNFSKSLDSQVCSFAIFLLYPFG